MILSPKAQAQVVGFASLVPAQKNRATPNNDAQLLMENKIPAPQQEEYKAPWQGDKALNDLNARYQYIANMRDHKKKYMQYTQYEEEQYFNQNKSLIGDYVYNVTREKAKTAVRTFQRAVIEDVKYSRREAKHESDNNQKITVYFNSPNKKSVASSKNKTKTKQAPRQTVVSEVDTEQNSDRKGGSDQAIEGVLRSAWKVTENIIERNQPIPIAKDTEARINYDVPGGTVKMNFVSPIVNAKAHRRVGSVNGLVSNRNNNQPLQGDKTIVGITKNFDEIELVTGVHYGVESSSIDYSLSKHIIGPVNAVANKTVSHKNAAANNTTVQMNLGFNF